MNRKSRTGLTTAAVAVTVLADRDAIVALASMDGIRVTASAKREPGDRPDDRTGTDLATARALARLAAKLERRARGAVRHAEDVRVARAARAAQGKLVQELIQAESAYPLAGQPDNDPGGIRARKAGK